MLHALTAPILLFSQLQSSSPTPPTMSKTFLALLGLLALCTAGVQVGGGPGRHSGGLGCLC